MAAYVLMSQAKGKRKIMTETPDDMQLAYADRIAKLLSKAQNTDSEHEAEALTSKAQMLMEKYAISEALLAQARGEHVQDQIIHEDFDFTGVYSSGQYMIAHLVAKQNHCRTLITKVTWEKPHKQRLTVIGFSRDVERVRLLNTSLQLQATVGMRRWWDSTDRSWMTRADSHKSKREFFFAFADGVHAKLAVANRTAREEAEREEAERRGYDGGTPDEVAADVSKSTELVLRTKKEQVDDWMDLKYGKLRSRTTRRAIGGGGARDAGYTAGRNSNTGDPGIGGGRRAIGR